VTLLNSDGRDYSRDMLKSRFVLLALIAVVLSFLATGHSGFADDQKAEKPGKVAKPRPPKLEDVLVRATTWARKNGHDQKSLVRITVIPTEVLDDDCLVAIVEFGNGAIGLFQGNSDSEEDRCVMLSKSDLEILDEVVTRAKRRS
jgi:hypothetical protein